MSEGNRITGEMLEILRSNLAGLTFTESPNVYKMTWEEAVNRTKKILNIKGLAILSDNQELPECDFCYGKGKTGFAGTSVAIYVGDCPKCKGTGKDMSDFKRVIKEE